MLSDKAKEIIDGTFYKLWREEMEAGSRMDKDTFKRNAFFYMQELEDMKLPIDWDKVEKFIEEEWETGYCTTWGEIIHNNFFNKVKKC